MTISLFELTGYSLEGNSLDTQDSTAVNDEIPIVERSLIFLISETKVSPLIGNRYMRIDRKAKRMI